MKKHTPFLAAVALCLCATSAVGIDDRPKPATAAEAAAGIIKNKYLSPFTGRSSGGTNALGYAPATNSTAGIVSALGYTPSTNFTYNANQFSKSGLEISVKSAAATTNNVFWSTASNNVALSILARTAYDASDVYSIDWQSRVLQAGDFTVMLNWSNSAAGLVGNAKGLTNIQPVNIAYTTNNSALASATNSLNMSYAYADFTATSPMSVTNFSNVDASKENSTVLIVTNGSGSDRLMTLPSGVSTMDGARSCTMSNNTVTIFSFSIYGGRFTNCAYRTFY